MIGIIDYNAGNIASIANALNRLKKEFVISSELTVLEKTDQLIFPGVGRAGAAVGQLKRSGLWDFIKNTNKPFLGICLGMQLLAEFSEEDNTDCLGVIGGKVEKFPSRMKAPQIGWNKVETADGNPLFQDLPNENFFYFVNSYYLPPNNLAIATSNYGVPFAAALNHNNFFGTQFHPEKSGEIGLKILDNFCSYANSTGN